MLLAQAEEHDHSLLADDEEEEDEGLGYLLTAVEQQSLAEDGNIKTDPFEDLFGHQDEFLQNLNESRVPSPDNVLRNSNNRTSGSVSNAVADAIAAVANSVAASNNTNSLADSPTVQATTITSPSVENPGLNTACDADITGMGDGSGDQHAIKLRCWKQKIKNLEGTPVKIKSKNQVVKWTVAKDVDPPVASGAAERPNLGMHAFDFEDCPSDELFECMFLELLWTDIDSQLSLLNAGILYHNNALPSCRQKIKIFTKRELILGYALFIAAAGFNEKGPHLFTSDQDNDSFYPPLGFDKHMKYHRFKFWKQLIVQVNEDSARKRDDDPWWRFASAVEGFNKVYRENITTSLLDILDEAMSAFRPRSTATSKLPNISVILRKPEPLGSEFKCIACPVAGTMKCPEIQRGAKPMQNAKYSKEHGCTSGCSLRLVDASDQPIEPGQKRGMEGLGTSVLPISLEHRAFAPSSRPRQDMLYSQQSS
jgi:hypothetical protein